MNDVKIHFGFRVEGTGKSSVIDFVQNPYYFTRPRKIDEFDKRADIEIPAGKAAAGVWFFNTIDSLKDSIMWHEALHPRIITRINMEKLRKDGVVEDRAMGTEGKASIAISFYSPSMDKSHDEDDRFVKSLVVPEDLIDVWDGKQWIKKKTVTLRDIDDILHRAEWGRYPPPSSAEAFGEATHHSNILCDNHKNWRSLASTESKNEDVNLISLSKGVIKLYRRARHAFTLRKLQQQEEQFISLAEWHLRQDALLKKSGDHRFRSHFMKANSYQTDARRTKHEQNMVLSGKKFWQLYDLDAWAHHALHLERIDDPVSMYREVPTSAVLELIHRMDDIRHEARQVRSDVATKRNQSRPEI